MIEIMNPAEKAKLLPTTGSTNDAPTDHSSSSSYNAPPAYVVNHDIECQQTSQQTPSLERPKSVTTGRFIKALVFIFVICLAVWACLHAQSRSSESHNDPHSPVGNFPAPPYDPSLPHSDEPTDSRDSLSWSQPVLHHGPNQNDPYYDSQTPVYHLDQADLQLIRVLGPQSVGSILYKGVHSTADHASVQVEARWDARIGSNWGVAELDRIDGGLYTSKEKSRVTEFLLMTKESLSVPGDSDSSSRRLQFHIIVFIPTQLNLDSTWLAFEGNIFSTVYESLRSVQVGSLSVKINAGSITADDVSPNLTNFKINTGSVYGKYRPSSDFTVRINSGSVHASLIVPLPSSSASSLLSSSSSGEKPLRLPQHNIQTNTGSIELEYTSVPNLFSPHINLITNAGHVNLRLPHSFRGSYDTKSNTGSVDVIDENRSGRVKEDGADKTWVGKRSWGWIGKGQREKNSDGNGSVLARVNVGSISVVVV